MSEAETHSAQRDEEHGEGPGVSTRKAIGAVLGLALAGLAWQLPFADPLTARMLAVALWMATWWITEAVPIPVTSLLPLVLLPAFGIADLDATAANYGKPTIFLFLGGFLLALGLQRSGVHRRIALAIVAAIGTAPPRLLLGFMVANATLSMWISNTASVLVALPIAMSVIEEARSRGADPGAIARFATALMLGIAYAADIGGMATLVGTPPNLVYAELQSQLLPDTPPVSFGQWMLFGLPLSTVFLFVGWRLLSARLFRLEEIEVFAGARLLADARRALGPMRRDEALSAAIFCCAALAWMSGADLEIRELVIPGWRSLTGLEALGDASVAVGFGLLLFLIPSAAEDRSLLDWDTARQKLPWGLLLLFGGGFALAMGFVESGLSAAIGAALQRLVAVPTTAVIALVCLILTFLTEVTSNTATTTLVLPILAEAGAGLGMDPRALMIPATLSASCAFMMPVASPTQAIVFGSGYVSIRDMVRAGIWFNLVGVALVTIFFVALAGPIFGVSIN